MLGLWFLRCAERVKAKRQESGAPPVGEEAEVPNAHETFGKQMQQEPLQEFVERRAHEFLFVVVSRVAPAEGDLPLRKRDQAMAGDGHTMRVAGLGRGGKIASVILSSACDRDSARRASHPVFVHRFACLLHAAFRHSFEATPLRFAITSHPSGCEEDLHLPAVRHARHTRKRDASEAPTAPLTTINLSQGEAE